MRTTLVAIGSLVALTATAFAGQVEYGSGVFSPEAGVICDRNGQFCADGTGLSASWSEQYLGAEAAGKLADVEQSVFGYSNRVKCTVATRSCEGGKGKTAKKMTKMLFGN